MVRRGCPCQTENSENTTLTRWPKWGCPEELTLTNAGLRNLASSSDQHNTLLVFCLSPFNG